MLDRVNESNPATVQRCFNVARIGACDFGAGITPAWAVIVAQPALRSKAGKPGSARSRCYAQVGSVIRRVFHRRTGSSIVPILYGREAPEIHSLPQVPRESSGSGVFATKPAAPRDAQFKRSSIQAPGAMRTTHFRNEVRGPGGCAVQAVL